ncbi:hypothetical protein Tco_0189857 [Tanacetum coccineum]
MEVFLILLREIESEPQFQYHFGCKTIKLSHVYFADDWLVMFHRDPTSMKVIKKALDNFSAYFGLIPNNSKSIIFFGSMKEEEQNAISYVLPFAIGKLPVRYLGVLLIAKRLGVKECGCPASVFLLPATIIKEINRLLKNFLWNQSEKTNGKAKVAWSSICKPKDRGGMGLKNLQTWNYALLAKHVWNIATKKDSLWVKWVHSVKLRGKSIWDVKEESNDSWGWKNLLEIRDQIKDKVIYKVGDGSKTSLWFDNWSSIGPLFQYITHRDLYDKRLSENITVRDMIVNERWRWPQECLTTLFVWPWEEMGSSVWLCKRSNAAECTIRKGCSLGRVNVMGGQCMMGGVEGVKSLLGHPIHCQRSLCGKSLSFSVNGGYALLDDAISFSFKFHCGVE